MTPPEVRLWVALRGKAQAGLRFRRQHPFDPYILDFYCDAAALAVEIDGEGHGHPDQATHDRRRDDWLRSQGVRTLRVDAKDVYQNLDGVVEMIVRTARAEPDLSSPAKRLGGSTGEAGDGGSDRER